MYIPLIFFFISLAGIMTMIGRKMSTVSFGEVLSSNDFSHPFVPDIQKVKEVSVETLKKIGHFSLVATLRYYVRLTNFTKSKYQSLRERINNKIHTGGDMELKGNREISKFLKIISEYKVKIRDIKQKIHEEENNL